MPEIISVVNKFDIYDKCVRNNSFMNTYKLHAYDNRENVMGIADSYNDYIENKMPQNDWLIFCHQDYSIQEDLKPFLSQMNINSIYGTVGVAKGKDFMIHLKTKDWKIKKFRFGFYPSTQLIGHFLQGDGPDAFWTGKSISKETEVECVDCCCLMIHSSLIRKYNLRFDSRMNWHLYSEEFSMNARKSHNIKTKVIQIKNQHIGHGTLNSDFYETLDYFKSKYPDTLIATSCYDGYYERFKERL